MNLGKKVLITVITLVFVIGIVVVGFEIKYWNRAYPGVKVLGVNQEGKTAKEIEFGLEQKAGQTKKIKLKWGASDWVVEFFEIGANYDLVKTSANALSVGRSGDLKKDLADKISNLSDSVSVPIIYYFDESKLSEKIKSISSQIDIPAREPEVIYDKVSGIVDVSPGENGQAVDESSLIREIKSVLSQAEDKIIEVPVISLQPKLNDLQLESAKLRAQRLVGKKVVVNFADEGQKWELSDEELVTWVDLSSGSGQSGWKKLQIEEWTRELALSVNRPAQNASFQFVSPGRVQEFKPAKDGYEINQVEVYKNMVSALNELESEKVLAEANLVVDKVEPTVKNSEVNDLGIKELIGKGESWFSGSIDNRIFNLQKATTILNGVLVAPGEVFSFNQVVGEISANTGFKQAYIIKEGKTILGDGGGVCQTSTTLFRAVLAAGLPITERTAHAYRVHYYEEKYQPGFDATVFQPSPDFKFENDTPAYILIQTNVDLTAKKLTYEIYGTSDGRKVEISKARTWEVTAPPPDLYQDDPTLKAGVVRQVEHAAWGAKIAFDWKVTRGEEVLQERTFYSNYRPWQAVYLRGTKI
jgi:vancomycin resistance protein YoaR